MVHRHDPEPNRSWSMSSPFVPLGHPDKPIVRRVGAPYLGRPAQQLADPDIGLLAGDAAELFCYRIELKQGAWTEVAYPYNVVLVDIYAIRLRPVARQPPGSPCLRVWIETDKLAGEKLTDPESTMRVRPDPTRALPRRRRLDDRGRTCRDIDARDVAAGQGREIDRSGRSGGDAIGTRTARRVPHAHIAGCRIDAAINATLTGEPQLACLIERCSIEIGSTPVSGQREAAGLMRGRVEAQDGIEAAIGHPGCAVRTNDDAVRRRAATQRKLIHMARARIKQTERTARLGREPHSAIRCGRDIMRATALGQRKFGPSKCCARAAL